MSSTLISQADHLSGGTRLAQMTVLVIVSTNQQIPSLSLRLQIIRNCDLGNANIRVLHTPGHTPESISAKMKYLTGGASKVDVIDTII